jgi:hypothetical protein
MRSWPRAGRRDRWRVSPCHLEDAEGDLGPGVDLVEPLGRLELGGRDRLERRLVVDIKDLL